MIIVKLFKNMRIRNRIFFLNVFVIVLALTILSYYANQISTKAIVDKAVKSSTRELFLIDNSLRTMVNEVENYANILSTDYRVQQQLSNYLQNSIDPMSATESRAVISKALSGVTSPNTSVLEACVMTYDNTVLDVGLADKNQVKEIFNNSFIDNLRKNKKTVWMKLFKFKYDYGSEENAFAVAKPSVSLELGKVLGTVLLFISEKKIASVYESNAKGINVSYYILDKNGVIMSSSNKKDLYGSFIGVAGISKDEYRSIINDEPVISRLNNRDYLFLGRDFTSLDWEIISMVPIDEITKEKTEINRIILKVGITCLIFSFFLTYLLSITISRPIVRLSNIMKKARSGDLNIRANFKSGAEIGMLGDGFNELMDKIGSLLHNICEEQKAKRNYEFKLLQSQIKPHFLYNAIETFSSFVKLDMKENALSSAQNLANFYRISLSNGNDVISIREEYQLIDNYLSLQKMRYVEYMDYFIEMEEEILDYKIPKLTLQPLVENSIYHGLKQREQKGGVLEVKGYKNEDIIIFEVYDNGVGIPVEKINRLLNENKMAGETKDFGLYSVHSRIKLFYGDKYGLSIESEVGAYTRVRICLPAITEGGV